MLEIRNLTVAHRKDLKELIKDFSFKNLIFEEGAMLEKFEKKGTEFVIMD